MPSQPFTRAHTGVWLIRIGGALALVGFFFPAYSFLAPDHGSPEPFVPLPGYTVIFLTILVVILFGRFILLPLLCLVTGTCIAAVLSIRWASHRRPERSLFAAAIGLVMLVMSFYALLFGTIRTLPTPHELLLQPLLLFVQPGCWPLFFGFVIAIIGSWLRSKPEPIPPAAQPQEAAPAE